MDKKGRKWHCMSKLCMCVPAPNLETLGRRPDAGVQRGRPEPHEPDCPEMGDTIPRLNIIFIIMGSGREFAY